MRYLTGAELEKAKKYLAEAAEEAKKSTCIKSKRGVVIARDGVIIGRGHNQVTIDDFCNPCIREDIKDNSKVELCSAAHAEYVGIVDALRKVSSLKGFVMYHIKVKDGEMRPSGKPSCTTCSREIVIAEISAVVIWHLEGYAIYRAKEFNELSYRPFLKNIR
jgi:deoxycytidylate deaminase